MNMSTNKVQSSSEKKNPLNGFSEERRPAKSNAPSQENGDFPNFNMQSVSNMRISTQTGKQKS